MTTDSERDAFNAFFMEYAGPAPGAGMSTQELERDAIEARTEADKAASLFKLRQIWEAKRSAALAAWSEARYHRPATK